jgi:hypothetical protein
VGRRRQFEPQVEQFAVHPPPPVLYLNSNDVGQLRRLRRRLFAHQRRLPKDHPLGTMAPAPAPYLFLAPDLVHSNILSAFFGQRQKFFQQSYSVTMAFRQFQICTWDLVICPVLGQSFLSPRFYGEPICRRLVYLIDGDGSHFAISGH